MQADNNHVSLLVIAYNEEVGISECLTALVNLETNRSISIIVVDDGSTDATASIVESFAGNYPNVQLYRHERNRGRGAARLTALSLAGTGYVGFVDADIVVPRNWLSNLLRDLGDGAAISGLAVPDGDVAPLARIFGLHPRVVRGSAEIAGGNVLFAPGILDTVAFPTTKLGEDFRLAARLRSQGCVLRTSTSTVVEHREHKTYGQAFKWLFWSGVDASSLRREFGLLRLPDRIAQLFTASLVLVVAGPLLGLPLLAASPLLVIALAGVGHVATRFHYRPRPLAFLAAALANIPLIGAYLTGRVIGTLRRNESQ